MNLLRRVWQAWKRDGQLIGDAIARVVLTLFYFTFFAPFGLGMRLWGGPLQIRPRQQIAWLARTTRGQNLDDARKLF